MIEELIVATRSNQRPVKKGDIVAGARVIPLAINEEKLKRAEEFVQKTNIISVLPFRSRKVGIITTGSEVYHGRIKDKFGPVVKRKVEVFGCEVIEHIIVPDVADEIAAAVKMLLEKGAELILTTGGMSVDPDDVTPSGIKAAGANIVTYAKYLLSLGSNAFDEIGAFSRKEPLQM